jgi:hypothetical protein
MKKIAVALAGAVLVVLLIGAQGAASPLRSPLPCPADVTLPGSVCVVYPPDAGAQAVRAWRVWLPVVGR